jgi:hypothetical protein
VLTGHGGRLAGQFRSAAEPSAQCLRQCQPPSQADPFVLPARSGLGGHGSLEDVGRLVQTAGPQLDGGMARQHPSPDVRMPGQLPARDLVEHALRAAGGRRRRR